MSDRRNAIGDKLEDRHGRCRIRNRILNTRQTLSRNNFDAVVSIIRLVKQTYFNKTNLTKIFVDNDAKYIGSNDFTYGGGGRDFGFRHGDRLTK